MKSSINEIVGVPAGAKLPSHTSIGCYPIVYLTADGECLCAACAGDPDNDAVHADVYWEGPDMQCDACNATIESAYGDPEAEDS